MARDHKFPDPKDYPPKFPAVLCPSERVLYLYNQESGKSAKRIAKKVKKWFTEEAHRLGWAGVRFLPEVQTQHSAGAILWQPPSTVNVQITVTKQTLVLAEAEDDAEEETESGGT
jgi:hypothetical protein